MQKDEMNTQTNTQRDGSEAAAAREQDAKKVQAGQLRHVPIRRHPRMVYGNPDEFFLDLLMEQMEEQ
jgi:hypothetical protein